MRMIDADALLKSAGIFEAKACARGCGKSVLHLAKAWLWNEVSTAPTIDAVPVVRCWQCKHHEREQDPCHGRTQHYCKKLKAEVYKDFFCGYGARMDGDG